MNQALALDLWRDLSQFLAEEPWYLCTGAISFVTIAEEDLAAMRQRPGSPAEIRKLIDRGSTVSFDMLLAADQYGIRENLMFNLDESPPWMLIRSIC